MEDLNTISLTSDTRKWYFLESDLSPAEAVKDLSYGEGYYAPDGPGAPAQPPEVALTPPLASDVAAFDNDPGLGFRLPVKYEVDKATILQFLKSGKRVKVGKPPFRNIYGSVGDFGADTRAKLEAMNEGISVFLPQAGVQAKGTLVTRNFKFYFWVLHSDKALYLTDFKDHCWLMFN
jgi:hypothetical protein